MSSEVDDALDDAAKPQRRKPDPFPCTDAKRKRQAAAYLRAKKQFDALEELVERERLKILSGLQAWHLDQCRERGAYEPSLLIDSSAGTLRVTFGESYEKIPEQKRDALRDLAGKHFDEWFTGVRHLTLQKDVTKDKAKLDALVAKLLAVLGHDAFVANFQVEQLLKPTKVFTEAKIEMDAVTLDAFTEAGVVQTPTLKLVD